jgi:glutamyl-tRNA synthetase
MIHGPDGAKLSKRHGAQAVSEFADLGYLPEAMRNYLARLGWGHGDDEIFDDSQAIAWFDVADVVRAPARLDWHKLNHVNNLYIRAAANDRLAGLVLTTLAAEQVSVTPEVQAKLLAAVPLVKDGAKTILELVDLTAFALKERPLELDNKSKALLTEETVARLARLSATLALQTDWSNQGLNVALRAFASKEGVGMGTFGPALRGVLSGDGRAPDLASALAALGSSESLGRIDDALSHMR